MSFRSTTPVTYLRREGDDDLVGDAGERIHRVRPIPLLSVSLSPGRRLTYLFDAERGDAWGDSHGNQLTEWAPAERAQVA